MLKEYSTFKHVLGDFHVFYIFSEHPRQFLSC